MYISINQFHLLLNFISILLALYFYKYGIQIIVLIRFFAKKSFVLLIHAAYLSDFLCEAPHFSFEDFHLFAIHFNCIMIVSIRISCRPLVSHFISPVQYSWSKWHVHIHSKWQHLSLQNESCVNKLEHINIYKFTFFSCMFMWVMGIVKNSILFVIIREQHLLVTHYVVYLN